MEWLWNSLSAFVLTKWAELTGLLVSLLPDWLLFLRDVPTGIWWALSCALAFVWGRWRLPGLLAALTLGISVFALGWRAAPHQSYGELDHDPQQPEPEAARPQRPGILQGIFKRRRYR